MDEKEFACVILILDNHLAQIIVNEKWTKKAIISYITQVRKNLESITNPLVTKYGKEIAQEINQSKNKQEQIKKESKIEIIKH